MSVLTQPNHGEVVAIAEEVWSSYIDPSAPLVPFGTEDFPVGWSGLVAISGEWAGVVIVDVLDTVAHAITTTMFGDDVTVADTADAIGEFVNMIGGNVKALMNSESNLSLPVVAAGRVWAPSGSEEVVRADLASASGPLRVTVHQLHVQPHGVL